MIGLMYNCPFQKNELKRKKILPLFHTWIVVVSAFLVDFCNIPALLVYLLFQVITYVHNYGRKKIIINLLQNIHLMWAVCSGFTSWT
jgi:uncharacterized membrane protein YqhA